MANFVYVYARGEMPETPQAQEDAMQAWGAWFETLGDKVIDMGNPFGSSVTVKSGGSSERGASGLTGYSVLEAESLDAAAAKTDGCPILQSGGTVEVYETIAM